MTAPSPRRATIWLAFRSILWTALLPGLFAGYVPLRFFGLAGVQLSLRNPMHIVGLVAIGLGAGLLGACIWEFGRSGRGTLAPVDPPRELVVRGLYRYVRNPMYLSVTVIVLGEFLLTGSRALLVYWAVWFVAVNLFVIGYEEPTLRRRFGDSYERYTREVGRWLPRLSATIAALLIPGILHGQDPASGTWQGYWARSGDTLLVTLDIQPGDAPNRYRASFSSDRLRVAGIPFASAEREAGCLIRLTLRGDATTSVFQGTIKGDSITGTFIEAGAAGTFALRRGPNRSAPREEDVQFSNGAVRLSGTLILPSSAPPYPAVVMVHGSGAEGRWANRFLANRFAQAGVAALIFDKRGVGHSTGDWQSAGFENLAADAASGVAMLRGRRDIRSGRIGVFGHSQGGTILPLVAEAAGGVAFLIASAASAVATDSAERFSLRNAVGFSTLPPDEAARANQYVEALVRVAYHSEPRESLDSLAAALAGKPWYFAPPPPASHYWAFSRRIAGYEPQRHWMQVAVPVMLLYGKADQRVPAEASVQIIRGALAAAHRDPPTVCVYAGADHTQRVRLAGDVWPRNAPGYLEDLITWVRLAVDVDRRTEQRAGRLSNTCTFS